MKKNNFIFTALCVFQLFIFFNQNINAMAQDLPNQDLPNRDLSNRDLPSRNLLKIKIGSSSLTNFLNNHANEDTFCSVEKPEKLPFLEFYAGLFDGHGGIEISEYAKQELYGIIEFKILNQYHDLESQLVSYQLESSQCVEFEELLKSSFIELDQKIKDTLSRGCTASICLLINNNLYLAHAGDSRMIVSKNKKLDFATTDHKPNNPVELERILREGGSVWCNGTIMPNDDIIKYAVIPGGKQAWRIGPLGISRSIGDYTDQNMIDAVYNCHEHCRDRLKDEYVRNNIRMTEFSRDNFQLTEDGRMIGFSCIPDVKKIEIDSSYDFIILASDGLWDVISNEEAIEFVQRSLDDGRDVQEITDKLVKKAQIIGSDDDITVTIVEFDWNSSRSLIKKSDQKKSLDGILKTKLGFLHKKLPKSDFFTY